MKEATHTIDIFHGLRKDSATERSAEWLSDCTNMLGSDDMLHTPELIQVLTKLESSWPFPQLLIAARQCLVLTSDTFYRFADDVLSVLISGLSPNGRWAWVVAGEYLYFSNGICNVAYDTTTGSIAEVAGETDPTGRSLALFNGQLFAGGVELDYLAPLPQRLQINVDPVHDFEVPDYPLDHHYTKPVKEPVVDVPETPKYYPCGTTGVSEAEDYLTHALYVLASPTPETITFVKIACYNKVAYGLGANGRLYGCGHGGICWDNVLLEYLFSVDSDTYIELSLDDRIKYPLNDIWQTGNALYILDGDKHLFIYSEGSSYGAYGFTLPFTAATPPPYQIVLTDRDSNASLDVKEVISCMNRCFLLLQDGTIYFSGHTSTVSPSAGGSYTAYLTKLEEPSALGISSLAVTWDWIRTPTGDILNWGDEIFAYMITFDGQLYLYGGFEIAYTGLGEGVAPTGWDLISNKSDWKVGSDTNPQDCEANSVVHALDASGDLWYWGYYDIYTPVKKELPFKVLRYIHYYGTFLYQTPDNLLYLETSYDAQKLLNGIYFLDIFNCPELPADHDYGPYTADYLYCLGYVTHSALLYIWNGYYFAILNNYSKELED
jgi:hypothetical protein